MGWEVMTDDYLKTFDDEHCVYCQKRVNPGDAFYLTEQGKLEHARCTWERIEKEKEANV